MKAFLPLARPGRNYIRDHLSTPATCLGLLILVGACGGNVTHPGQHARNTLRQQGLLTASAGGSLPASNVANHGDTLSGKLAAQASVKAPVPRVLKPVPAGFALNSPEFRRLYGPGVFNQDSLANTIVGIANLSTPGQRSERLVSNRFLATTSARLSNVRVFFAIGPGYSLGNGGHIEVSLYPDDGSAAHLPDLGAAALARTWYRPMLAANHQKNGRYPLLTFSSGQPLQAGKLYHLVFRNIDSRPELNFISTNNSASHQGNGRPGRWLNTRDWSTLYAMRTIGPGSQPGFKWTNLTAQGSGGKFFSPILDMSFSNGQRQGVTDFEAGSVEQKPGSNTKGRVYLATAAKPVRERFTPSASKLVSGLSVATAAAVGGQLKWQILQGSTELASGYIKQQTPNYKPLSASNGNRLANMIWYDISLPRNIQLKAGQHYDVQFTPTGTSQWKFSDHRNGSDYGFRWPAAFTESQAQHKQGNRWLNTYHWDYTRSGRASNWPVVLHLAPGQS